VGDKRLKYFAFYRGEHITELTMFGVLVYSYIVPRRQLLLPRGYELVWYRFKNLKIRKRVECK